MAVKTTEADKSEKKTTTGRNGKNKKDEDSASPKEVTFEDGLARLDEIIQALENESIPLATLMQLYEEGVSLLNKCNDCLDQAEQKVKILKISSDGTKAHLEDFSESASDLDLSAEVSSELPDDIDMGNASTPNTTTVSEANCKKQTKRGNPSE